MLEDIKGRTVLVLGLARSGRAAVRLLIKAAASKIVANDCKEREHLKEALAEFAGFPQVKIVAGGHPLSVLEGVSLIIKSPGINPGLPILKRAARLGIKVYSEVELAYRFSPVPLVGITGTNGKTTTASLVGEMFRQKYTHVHVAGNIGFPLCEAVSSPVQGEIIVAELSSFQLENIDKFRVSIAAILNIAPDHLDYHSSVENYSAAKKNILVNQCGGDWAVLNWDDRRVKGLAPEVNGRLLFFSRREELEAGVCLKDGNIVINSDGSTHHVCPAGMVKILGLHNLENALAAAAVSWAGGVETEKIASVLKTFPGVAHRLEEVARINGITFINDSKGTNPDATVNALRALKGPKILIAGGVNKGSDFRPLVQVMLEEGVKKLVLLGESASQIAAAVRGKGLGEPVIVPDMDAAVKEAFSGAAAGDTVVLSPSCASWDMFENYEERGEIFAAAVRTLKEGLQSEKNLHRE